VLHWARQETDGTTFETNINREGFASPTMRDFVAVFRETLAAAGAPTDADTVWRLLRRFNIMVFDFGPASDYEHRGVACNSRTACVLACPPICNVHRKLTGAAHDALADIRIGWAAAPGAHTIASAETLLEQHRVLDITGEGGVGKSAVLKHLAQRLAPEVDHRHRTRRIILAAGRPPKCSAVPPVSPRPAV
jgi:hypothetical protein